MKNKKEIENESFYMQEILKNYRQTILQPINVYININLCFPYL